MSEPASVPLPRPPDSVAGQASAPPVEEAPTVPIRLVEPVPIRPSVPEPARPGGRRLFTMAVIGWLVAVLAAVAATGGFILRSRTAGDLSDTRATLRATQSQLTATKGQLATVQSQLATTKGDLASVQNQLVGTQDQATKLSDQNASLTKHVNSCQDAFKVTYLMGAGRMGMTPANMEQMRSDITECYGSWPTWLP